MKFLRLNQRLINLNKIIYAEESEALDEETGKAVNTLDLIFSNGTRLTLIEKEADDFVDALSNQNAIID